MGRLLPIYVQLSAVRWRDYKVMTVPPTNMAPSGFLVKDAKFLLLTYAQIPDVFCATLPLSVVSRGSDLGAEVLVSREYHRDGGIHFHVFVDFGGRKYSTRDARAWDVEGFHPNIERVGRTPEKAYDYVIKDGDIVAGGATRPEPTGRDGGQSSDWEWIVDAQTRDEFFERIRERQPKSLVTAFSNVSKFADWAYRVEAAPYHHRDDFTFELEGYPVLRDWVDDSIRGNGADR